MTATLLTRDESLYAQSIAPTSIIARVALHADKGGNNWPQEFQETAVKLIRQGCAGEIAMDAALS